MRNVLVLMIAILACTLVGCGQSYHWSKAHPAYKQAPYGQLTVAGVQNAFVLTRTGWFAKRLDFNADSIQVKATAFCAQILADELQKGYGKFTSLQEKALSAFPEESQKIDDRIFIKGHFPEQGLVLKDSIGNIPPMILLVHEAIIGTDLRREDFFDYALIHNESQEKKTVANVSLVISYTLWDNLKQRPLFSAVDEIQQPAGDMSNAQLEVLVRKAAQQIKKNLSQESK